MSVSATLDSSGHQLRGADARGRDTARPLHRRIRDMRTTARPARRPTPGPSAIRKRSQIGDIAPFTNCRRRESLIRRVLRQTRKAVLLEQLPRRRQSGAHRGAEISHRLRRHRRRRSRLLHHAPSGHVRIHHVGRAERWSESAGLHPAKQISGNPSRRARSMRRARWRSRRLHRRSHALPLRSRIDSLPG